MILEIYNLFNDHDFTINDMVKITFLYKDIMYSKQIDDIVYIPENQIIREYIWCHVNNNCKDHLIVEIANPCYYSKNKNYHPLKPGDILRIHKKYVKSYNKYMSMEYIMSIPNLIDINDFQKQNIQYHELKQKFSLFRKNQIFNL